MKIVKLVCLKIYVYKNLSRYVVYLSAVEKMGEIVKTNVTRMIRYIIFKIVDVYFSPVSI